MESNKQDQTSARTPAGVRLSDIDAEKAYSAARKLTAAIETAIVGKHREVVLLVTALLAGMHVLIEDVPGVGKTTLASALAGAAGLDFRRAQFTPDITASDITGFNIYKRSAEEFVFSPGLIMTNVLLADEINRASPKTQSALLEAMEENCVTVDGKTYRLPDPFIVIATQNPSGFVGTHPLPEAQLDRFGIRLTMGYPSVDEEMLIVSGKRSDMSPTPVKPAVSPSWIRVLRALAENVHIDAEVIRYAVALVSATRKHPAVSLGASPRASIALTRLSQAYAFMNSRDYVIPEDVYELFDVTAAHRLILKNGIGQRSLTVHDVTREILDTVKIPYKGKH